MTHLDTREVRKATRASSHSRPMLSRVTLCLLGLLLAAPPRGKPKPKPTPKQPTPPTEKPLPKIKVDQRYQNIFEKRYNKLINEEDLKKEEKRKRRKGRKKRK